MPPLGDQLATRFRVPIGFVPCGSGGTSVREWLPAGIGFTNPPTVEVNVEKQLGGTWVSKGGLYAQLVQRLRRLGPHGFRAVLWHQGESDAHQQDSSRTLAGPLYHDYLAQIIRSSRRECGWDAPWFVAQASYHTPDDSGSAEIRAAQQALWTSGVAEEGPDTDQIRGDFRDERGMGVHFSGVGLREHAARWSAKISPWLELRQNRLP